MSETHIHRSASIAILKAPGPDEESVRERLIQLGKCASFVEIFGREATPLSQIGGAF